MQGLLERLKGGEVLFCDGGMGTFLQAKGLTPGECPELWCVDKPAEVQDVHRQYKAAGSDMVETNSFGGTTYKLKHYGLEDRCAEINEAAARIAKAVAGDDQYVLGSAGPTGAFMEPYGDETEPAFLEAFRVQMVALEKGGADVVIVETMAALEETVVAIQAAKESTKLVVIASMTFDPKADGSGYVTMMGVTPERFAEEAVAAGADILATNCGLGPDHMLNIIKALRGANGAIPLMAMPNAGMPVVEGDQTVFKETPAQMAEKVPVLVEAGANIIGGCCGTGPEHIAAMKQAIAK